MTAYYIDVISSASVMNFRRTFGRRAQAWTTCPTCHLPTITFSLQQLQRKCVSQRRTYKLNLHNREENCWGYLKILFLLRIHVYYNIIVHLYRGYIRGQMVKRDNLHNLYHFSTWVWALTLQVHYIFGICRVAVMWKFLERQMKVDFDMSNHAKCVEYSYFCSFWKNAYVAWYTTIRWWWTWYMSWFIGIHNLVGIAFNNMNIFIRSVKVWTNCQKGLKAF